MTATIQEAVRSTDVPDLIPARMLNEFAYCPRLAYLEWVQGEFADNLDTLEGRFDHRRVDQPSRGEVPEPSEPLTPDPSPARGEGSGRDPSPPATPDSEPQTPNSEFQPSDSALDSQPPTPNSQPPTIHSRSLMLSAPREGLIAKMDLVDISAATAIPVDYKHGRVPDIPGGAWEPERVQLCAQGLILRENGYQCEGGILYYVDSRRRVSIPFDDALVERTRELLAQMRRMAGGRTMPPPLEDSPKCPRCSLVGICLPDEITSLLAQGTDHEDKCEVRRLLPARDEALPLYLQEQGTTLGKSGDQLTVSRRGEALRKVRLIDVSQVSLFGNVQVTAQALRELSAAAVPVCHFSYGGWFHAVTDGLAHKNVELRMAQFGAAADPARSLALARQFVVGKIKNCRTLLRRHLAAEGDCPAGRGGEGVVDAENPRSPRKRDCPPRLELLQLAELADKAERAAPAESLLGIEGMAAKIYFAGFAGLLKGDATFDLAGRNRRPPRDPTNALLSFVYALLVKEWTLVLRAVGFDPMLGFYHRPRYGRPSLALDMAEPFRPLIADSVVLTLVNNGEVSAPSFIRRAGAVALTTAGRRAVLAAFERRMDTLVTHPTFGYRVSYRRLLEVQARLLARTLLGEIAEYPNFLTR